jgi:hypothetical protein
MNDARNAMPASQLTDARWVKSSHSGPTGGNCVEVASLADGTVAVRDSRHPAGPALVFTTADWTAFVAGTRNGALG